MKAHEYFEYLTDFTAETAKSSAQNRSYEERTRSAYLYWRSTETGTVSIVESAIEHGVTPDDIVRQWREDRPIRSRLTELRAAVAMASGMAVGRLVARLRAIQESRGFRW